MIAPLPLSHKQTIALGHLMDKTTRVLVYGGSWRSGKTFLALIFAVLSCAKKKGIRILVGRKYYADLAKTTINTLRTEIEPLMNLKGKFVWNENKHTYTCLATGSEILFAGLDPQGHDNTLGGLTLTHAIIDEASELTEDIFREIKGRLSYRLDENNIVSKLVIVSNPDRGYLFNTYYVPFEKGQLPDGTVYIPATMDDNNFLSDDYLSQMTEEVLGEEKYQLYRLGNWRYARGGNDLFAASDVYDLFTNNKDGLPAGQKMISVDPAGLGKDSTCIVVADGWYIVEIVKMEKADTPTVVARVNELRQKHNVPSRNIIVDCGGNAGHADYLRHSVRYHSNGKVMEAGNFNMLRSQLIYKLSDAIKKKTIRFSPFCAEYQDEFTAQAIEHKAYNSEMDAKQAVTPKDIVKKRLGSRWSSPDLFDAVYQLMYFSFKPKFQASQVLEF